MQFALALVLAALPTLSAWAAVAPTPSRSHTARAAVSTMILLNPDTDQALARKIVTNQPVTNQPQQQQELDEFLSRFQGHFDNHAQVTTNEAAGRAPRHGGGHEHIHCLLRSVPVLGADAGDTHVLASYYFNGQPGAIFRERLYAFEAVADDEQFGKCVRMAIYKLRDPVTAQLRAAGADDVAFSASCDLAEELHVPDADVYWRRCAESYEGSMRTESITIISERSGDEIVVRDDVSLWSDALWVNDRGTTPDGEYVYGNVHEVPYKMDRVPADHWTATGGASPDGWAPAGTCSSNES